MLFLKVQLWGSQCTSPFIFQFHIATFYFYFLKLFFSLLHSLFSLAFVSVGELLQLALH